jgi:hypothetical protein
MQAATRNESVTVILFEGLPLICFISLLPSHQGTSGKDVHPNLAPGNREKPPSVLKTTPFHPLAVMIFGAGSTLNSHFFTGSGGSYFGGRFIAHRSCCNERVFVIGILSGLSLS